MNQTWTVDPENRDKFTKTVISWGILIQSLGWDTLAEMYVNRVEPFQDVPKLSGKNRYKKAKQIILNTLAHDLKQAGLKVSNGT